MKTKNQFSAQDISILVVLHIGMLFMVAFIFQY